MRAAKGSIACEQAIALGVGRQPQFVTKGGVGRQPQFVTKGGGNRLTYIVKIPPGIGLVLFVQSCHEHFNRPIKMGASAARSPPDARLPCRGTPNVRTNMVDGFC